MLGPVHAQKMPPGSLSQPADLSEAERLNQQVQQLFQAGKYDTALPLAERALAMQEQALGPQHPLVAQSLNNLASLYQVTGKYNQAEPLLQRAVRMTERVQGPQHPEVATMLVNLAELYREKGDYQQAEPLYQRALAIRERALGLHHPNVAQSLNNLAALYDEKGDYQRAEPFYQRALRIYEQALPHHPNVAITLGNLAELYRNKGDYQQAEPLLRRALALREQVLGPQHPAVATTLDSLATLYKTTGDYERAEPLYRRALAIREQALGPHHPRVAHSLDHLAGLYRAKGDDQQAEPLYQRALALTEQALGPHHPDVAGILNNLGLLYQERGDYEHAEPLLQSALTVSEQALGPHHPLVATALDNLATLYRDKGDDQQAEPLYQRALTIAEQSLGPHHPLVATILDTMAGLYWTKSDDQRAEPLLQRALAIDEQALGPQHPDVANTLYSLAGLYQMKGDVAQALAALKRGADIRERHIARVLASGSDLQKRAYLAIFRRETMAMISFQAQAAPADPQVLRVVLTTVLRRKGRVLHAVTDSLGILRQRLEPEVQALLDQWQGLGTRLTTLVFQGPGERDTTAYRAQIAALEAQEQQLEAQISARSAEFRAQTQPVTLEEVQAAIPPDAALVEVVAYQPFQPQARAWGTLRYVAYVLRHQGAPAWVDLGDATRIDREVARLRRALTERRRQVQEFARALDDKVMRPIRPLLGDAHLVLLSPEGTLNLLPFGALVDEEQRYLIQRFTFTYLTTGSDLLRLQGNHRSRQGPLIIANPDFDRIVGVMSGQTGMAARLSSASRSVDFADLHFGALHGTSSEAAALAPLLPGVVVLSGAAATKAALQRVQGPRLLHVATHGFFLADQPEEPELRPGTVVRASGDPRPPPRLRIENPLLRSGLALAGANQRQSGMPDGVLTALEATGLDLWGTQLVVLSACETGLGEVKNGEGVYGLRRALVMAGAESQIMSLWKVADDATRDLMVAYYGRLRRGEGRAEALRQTQLEMLASPHQHEPFYWASFIPSGAWGPLAGQAAWGNSEGY
jgi:CHAT domain-containing protein/Tfp pilus assembly protein PilF